jgi:hypothetical protein
MNEKRPGPYRSKLRPHIDQIRRWRRSGKTWLHVVEELAELDVKTDPGSLCNFVKRYRKKPYPIGAEPEELTPPAGPALLADPPAPKAYHPGDRFREAVRNQKPAEIPKPKVYKSKKNL